MKALHKVYYKVKNYKNLLISHNNHNQILNLEKYRLVKMFINKVFILVLKLIMILMILLKN